MHAAKRTDRIQDGVFFRRGERPPPCFLMVLLNFRAGTTAAAARAALGRVLDVVERVRRDGTTRDLEGAPKLPRDAFTCLVGYGARFFDAARHDPPLTAAERPAHLTSVRLDRAAFATIPWAADAGDEVEGEADVCLQLNGLTESAVARAAVEVWKVTEDEDLPLRIAGLHRGFQRDDGRSWIDFHDGLGNIESSHRLAVIEAPPDPRWMGGGTYLAFLRVLVDLVPWRKLTRAQQEVVVGRDKLTGCPLVRVEDDDGKLVPVTLRGCPAGGGTKKEQPPEFFDPPQRNDRLVEASHIHRANQSRAADVRAAARVFRQGYEFLDAIDDRGPRLGLNFVSFQMDLECLKVVLGTDGWLGDVNFGGPREPRRGEPPQVELMSLLAAGYYAVPPRAQPFPGAKLFEP